MEGRRGGEVWCVVFVIFPFVLLHVHIEFGNIIETRGHATVRAGEEKTISSDPESLFAPSGEPPKGDSGLDVESPLPYCDELLEKWAPVKRNGSSSLPQP